MRTPAGADVELRGEALRKQDPLRTVREPRGIDGAQARHLRRGAVSFIGIATIADIGRDAEIDDDRRRLRANIVLETHDSKPFLEDEWVGGTLLFGDGDPMPAVSITARDIRCVMVNLDPDTAKQDARMLKAVVRLNDNYAGVYGTVVRTGSIHVGQTVRFTPAGS